MRILIISQYFTPEVTAASLRLHPLARGLAARGHEVEVVCEVPNHPGGIKQPGYRPRPFEVREVDGFRVNYVWVTSSPSKRARHRLASYASYALAATVAASLRSRPDAVVASSPPLSVGAVGALVAARHRVPWIFDVRDLWPEIAVALGELSQARVLAAAEWLEQALYENAAVVTTPTEPFAEHVRRRCTRPEKVRVLANGTTGEWLRAGEAAPDRAGTELPHAAFVWTYAGNVGLSQDLGTALEAARLLGSGFHLRIVGDGAARASLQEAASGLPPGAVGFSGLVAPAEAARIMRASDSLLVSLADRPELEKSIPIKLYDCCALGRPVIVAAGGEVRRLAQEAGAALTVSPDDPQGLADAVRRLRDDAGAAAVLGANARRFASANLRDGGVDELEDALRDVARPWSKRGSL